MALASAVLLSSVLSWNPIAPLAQPTPTLRCSASMPRSHPFLRWRTEPLQPELGQQCANQHAKLSGGAPPWVRPALASAAGFAAAAVSIVSFPGAAHASMLDSAFVQSTSLIFVSELGDKTFFIAALLAARASKVLTFAGCAGALAIMTIVSVLIGQIFHQVPTGLTRVCHGMIAAGQGGHGACISPVFFQLAHSGLPIDDYVAIASFVFFGVKAIIDAAQIEDDGAGIAEESEEASETLQKSGLYEKSGWPLVFEACTLTIAAEIGDRSQIATIALAAAQNPYLVALGAIAGHCVATGMAVLGGSFISKYLSERVIGFVGGALFLVFAFTTAIGLF